MSGPDGCFVTIALEYKTGRMAPAGFFCLWTDQLTFVSSAWVRLVTPVIGVVPTGMQPAGWQDSRTRTRIPYADIVQVTSHKKGWVVVRTRSGQDYFFGGGQLNAGFDFPQISVEIAKALTAAGYGTNACRDSLTVGMHPTADDWDRALVADPQPTAGGGQTSPTVQLQKVRPTEHDQPGVTPAAMGNSPEVPATGLDPVTARGRVQTVLRPITLGAAGALLSAAAYAGFTILDKTQEYETSALLGAAVAVAVAVGSAAAGLGSLWTRVISLALTSLSLLLSEYVIDRHFVGLALPFRDMVTVIHDRLFADKWTFVSWGISLFFAWHAPNIASRLIEADSPSHEATGAGHRLRLWILGRGIWVTAAAAAAVGLAVLITLGRAGLDSPRVTVVDKTVPIARDQAGHVTRASAVPVQQVRAGDCYNEPPGRSLELLPVVPCQQSHDAEVYYTFDMAAETYPGDGAAATSADEACGRAFPTVAGPLDRYLGYNYFVPDRQTWDTGAHTVVCTMGRTDNKKLDGPVPTH